MSGAGSFDMGRSMVEAGADTGEAGPVSGFWRRSGALMVDSLLLGVLGAVLGAVFFDEFVSLGQQGRLIGVAILLPYYTFFHSSAGGGQTPGKRALAIKVVGEDGEPLSAPAALARACVFVLPFSLNGIVIADQDDMALWVALSFALFGVGGSIVYLAAFNRRSRQSLHDLVVGSWVVPAASTQRPPRGLPRVHVIVVSMWMAATLSFPVMAFELVERWPEFQQMQSLQRSVQREIDTLSVKLMEGKTWVLSADGRRETSFLRIDVRVPRKVDDFEAMARQVARVLFDDTREADWIDSFDQIRISVSYGYNIVIASANLHRSFDKTPDEWRALLDALPFDANVDVDTDAI